MNENAPVPSLGHRFNLSEWALTHRAIVLFAIIVCAIAGVLSYQQLGQSEDPPFTFKVMVVKTNWPGASARDMEQQVTDKIERKLQEVPTIDWVRSYSKPGESLVFFAIKDSAPAAQVSETWYQVRKKIGDIRTTLPQGIQGPFFNDEFGDTYTNIYALVGDGFDYRALKDFGDRIRSELLRVPGVAKVDFIGEQEEKIFIEVSNAKLSTLGLEPAQILQSLAAHFLTRLHTWQEDGFRPVHDEWLFRAEGREAPVTVAYGAERLEGQVLGLDESANLLLKTPAGGVRSLSYIGSADLMGPDAP